MIPSIFKEILERPFNPLVAEARDEGKSVLGLTCSYIPEPLVSVEGLQPVRVRAPHTAGTPMADTYLSSVICTYTRSLLEGALDGTYDFLDGWVFAASCDHLRRLLDNLEYLINPSFHYVLDLPHKTGDEALAWYEDDLKKLADALSAHFGVDTGPDALSQAIQNHNEHLGLLRSIGDLRKRHPPPISGTDFHTIMTACAVAPRDRLAQTLREVREALEGTDGIPHARARLAVVGSQLDDPGYIGIIESMGGVVVADRFCLGSIPGLEPVEEQGDPLRALAAHSLRKVSCPRMMEAFEERVQDVVRLVKEFRVDGVVLQTMKFCDTWGVESSPLTSNLRDLGIPVLRLEREYALSGEGQIKTRVQAFLESMGR